MAFAERFLLNDNRPSRRQFCCTAALTAGVAALSPGVLLRAADATDFRLRYILGSCMYGKLPLAEILPEVRKTGAEFIDIWPAPHGNQREQVEEMGHERFAEMLRQHGVRLGISTRYDLGPFALSDEIEVVQRLGGRMIVCGARGPKDLRGAELKSAVRNFVEQMRPHVERAASHGVTLAIENHANSLIDGPDSIRYLAELSPSEHLGVALAPYHLPQDPALIAGLIEDLGPRLVHFYAWQHGVGSHKARPKQEELLQMPGRGPLDFRPILATLQKIEYDGWTEIFMHPFPRGIPILSTAGECTEEINRARRYLESHLS